MWSLNDYRHAFMTVGLIGIIVLCVPSALVYVHLPGGERFSELYVLGPTHMAEGYPFDVVSDTNYLVYFGVTNHLGNTSYYEVQVKLRNATEPLPNATSNVPSSLSMLYVYEAFLSDEQTWESNLNFSFSEVTFGSNMSSMGKFRINDAVINVNESAEWDSVNNGYFYQLFAELWIYSTASESFVYNNRFVSLWLNMTSTV